MTLATGCTRVRASQMVHPQPAIGDTFPHEAGMMVQWPSWLISPQLDQPK
jgi:hypothetical protein